MSFGSHLRHELANRELISFIGAYDVFSAAIAARYFDGIFISGFSFAASYYGLPDIGFIAWSDIVAFVQRVRTVLPQHHLMVDIDDGYCDVEVACHVVAMLESIGASGVILEDQKRPRRCGHMDGKQLLDLDDYLEKLQKVLATRRDLVVVARTDATEPDEVIRRVQAFADVGADVILADGLRDLSLLTKLKHLTDKPIMFNQIAGGKSPACTLTQLKQAGVSLVNFSTPCLFAAQAAIDQAMRSLLETDGKLVKTETNYVDVPTCNALLTENLALRYRN
jgi:2-methylisocitrate lyase-like PEP mutase family enzyme